jgi:chromate transporter
VQVVPGINLLGLTILIGRRVAGPAGVVIALVGLLLPSATITVLLTACYAHVQSRPQMRAALHGMVPAIVGLGMLTAWQMAWPYLVTSRREGKASLALSLALLAGSGLAAARLGWPVVLVLAVAGGIGAIASWWRARHFEGTGE